MSIFDAIGELCTMPLRCMNEVVKDLSDEGDDESDKFLSLLTFGGSSIIKGAAKTIQRANNKLD